LQGSPQTHQKWKRYDSESLIGLASKSCTALTRITSDGEISEIFAGEIRIKDFEVSFTAGGTLYLAVILRED
jgi:hypothetical protein